MSQDNIQDKIRDLLRLSANNSSENEAAIAMAMAQKLAEKHRIDIAMVELSEKTEPVEAVEKDNDPFIEGSRIREWKTKLLQHIVKSQGCSCYYHRLHGRDGNSTWYVYGRPSDVAIARQMFKWILAELEMIGPLFCKGKGRRYANGWYNGAVYAIAKGLEFGKEKAREGVNTTALVVVDQRAKESEAVMNTKENLSLAKSYNNRFDVRGWNDGHRVGSRMNVGSNLLK